MTLLSIFQRLSCQKMNRAFRYIPLAAVVCFLLLACGGRHAGSSNSSAASGEAVKTFPMIEVPGMISDPQERVDYMAEHFWDRFAKLSGVTDSSFVKGLPSMAVKEKFALWASILRASGPAARTKSLASVLSKAREDSIAVLQRLMEFADEFFYDPNSPTRDEEIYLTYLDRLLDGPLPDEDQRLRYDFYKKLCSLNRPGTPAGDFPFMTPEGRIMRLYDVKAPYVLLIFSNPGCPLCASYQENLQKNVPLKEKLATGALKVVNIYPDDDIEAWEEYVRNYPPEWICGRDHINQLFSNNLYSLRAIPSLYLLDAEKKVILKDATYEEVEMKLYDIFFQ